MIEQDLPSSPPELPCDLLTPPDAAARWPWLVAAGALIVVAIAFVALRAKRRAARRVSSTAPSLSTAPAVSPEERALDRLIRLRDAALDDDAFHVEAAAIVRDFVLERCGVRAPWMSTEELAVALDADRSARVTALLARCDRVKFARGASTLPERARLLADAESCVRASGAAGSG